MKAGEGTRVGMQGGEDVRMPCLVKTLWPTSAQLNPNPISCLVFTQPLLPPHSLSTPLPFQCSMHLSSTMYEGKNTSRPSGMVRAKLTIALPRSSLYL